MLKAIRGERKNNEAHWLREKIREAERSRCDVVQQCSNDDKY